MNWRDKLLGRGEPAGRPIDPGALAMPGWELTGTDGASAHWRDAVGDVVSLTFLPPLRAAPALSQLEELRYFCRRLVEREDAGLIEVLTGPDPAAEAFAYISKRLRFPAFTFHGVVILPVPGGTWQWKVIAEERGTTGVREALVAARLLESGAMTIEEYEQWWARDPYDPWYCGVDRHTLRYLSDAEEYDAVFPAHPLTKVRREVKRLLLLPLEPVPPH